MYEFIDTTQVQSASPLPAEAVKFNGIWLDQKVPGFRTLHVSGRELLECEISDEQMGSVDGTQYQYKRYPFRTITVAYQLIAESDTAFREAYNQLNGLLDAEQAELLFNDETDKYFIATKASNSEVSPGMNRVTGDICFYCTDPRKHSTVEKTFSASLNDDGILEATIVNDGTESVPISYEITHNHENGYIGIVSEHGVMQYGLVEEADGENYQQNEILANSSHYKEWNPAADWEDDKGINGQNNANKTQGTFEVVSVGGYHNLALKTPGTTENGWNGAMKTFTIVDSNGDEGVKDLYMYMNSWFETGLMGQTGAQTAAFLDENNKLICSQSIWKSDTSGNTAHVDFAVGGDNPRIVKKIQFLPTAYDEHNPYNNGRGHSDMRKEGDKITFYWWGSYPSVAVPELKNVKVAKVQLYIAQYGARNMANQYVTRNYFRRVLLQAMHVEHWRDVPNRYQPGDVLSIDGETTKAYVNGMPRLDDEIAGTKPFHAPPGETKVQFCYSDFCETAPSVTARIREAYL